MFLSDRFLSMQGSQDGRLVPATWEKEKYIVGLCGQKGGGWRFNCFLLLSLPVEQLNQISSPAGEKASIAL